MRPKKVKGFDNVSMVSCGSLHTAFIQNGKLYTFGNEEEGQLGHGDTKDQNRPKMVEGLDNVYGNAYDNILKVSCGEDYTAFIRNNA